MTRDTRDNAQDRRDTRRTDPFFDGLLPGVGKSTRVAALDGGPAASTDRAAVGDARPSGGTPHDEEPGSREPRDVRQGAGSGAAPAQVPASGPLLTAALHRTFGGGEEVRLETGAALPSGSGASRGHALGGHAFVTAPALDLASPDDRQLIGHEVAHALQQRRGSALTAAALTASLRGELEAEAESAGRAFSGGKPFAVAGAAPPGVALFDDPQKQVVHMTLLAGDLLVLELDDHTRESVRITFHTQLIAGTYMFDTATRRIAQSGPLVGPSAQAAGAALEFYTPRDVTLAGLRQIPLEVTGGTTGGAHAGHRIEASPQLAVALPGTRVTYYVGMDPEIGGSYEYHWYCINDPAVVDWLTPAIYEGPRSPRWENAQWSLPGRHTVVCELTFRGQGVPDRSERLEFFQQVNTEQTELATAFSQTQAPEYTRFRAAVELQNLQLLDGALPDQRPASGPYIECAGANPAVPGIAPNLAYNTYTIHPSPTARKFRWYVRCASWEAMPTDRYYDYRRIQVDGQDALDLASDGPTARFILGDYNRYTLICEELDADGLRIGSRASYIQVVESQDRANQQATFRTYMQNADAAIGRIADGKEVALRAVYVNRESGERVPMQLYVGPDAADPNRIALADLLPGMDRLEYGGANIEEAIGDFQRGNAYPAGSIQLEVPANRWGIPTLSRTLNPTGQSEWATWSQRIGFGSLLLAGAGIIAGVIPGGQPVAAALFIAAATGGVISGGVDLYDRLQKAERSPLGIALDVAGIAASIIGGATAFRALRVGTALTFTGATGRFLFYAGFATNSVAGLLITIEGVDEISHILASDMPRNDKIGAIVRVLTNLIIQGALLALTVRDVNQLRTRIGSLVGDEVAASLQIDVLHSLNLLDDTALGALRGLPADQLSAVAELARLNPAFANRLAAIAGAELAGRNIAPASELISFEGQIRIDPARLATMTDEEIRDVLRVSRALSVAGGDISLLSTEDRALVQRFTASTGPGNTAGPRLRFQYQYDQATQFAQDVGATTDPRGAALFESMTDRDLARLYDVARSDRPSGTGAALNRQASNWALSRAPSTVGEYVNYVEMYLQQFGDAITAQTEAYQAQVQAAMNAGQTQQQAEAALSMQWFGQEVQGTGRVFRRLLGARLETEWGTSGPGTVDAAYSANVAALAGRIGPTPVTGASEVELIASVRSGPDLQFSSESSAAYHVDKHVTDLPPSEAPTADTAAARVNAYLASANATVDSGTVSSGVNQFGTRTLTFVRSVAEGGRTYAMTAFVTLTDDGRAFLASYYDTGRR